MDGEGELAQAAIDEGAAEGGDEPERAVAQAVALLGLAGADPGVEAAEEEAAEVAPGGEEAADEAVDISRG